MSKSWVASLGGFAYIIGILLAPLMDYFEIGSSALVDIILLILALILVGILYVSISHNRKIKLNDTIEFRGLQKKSLWIRPKSIKHILKVSAVYIWFLGLNLFAFMVFLESSNIMILIIATVLLYPFLLTSRITVEEGKTIVKIKA